MQVLLLKIGSTGIPEEMAAGADEITLASFTITGGGPVLDATGLDMNNTDVSDVQDLAFTDPATATINQTAGALVVDNIMAKDRENTMTTAGGVAFPVIADAAGEVDSFRLPALAGVPTAAPTNAGEGHLVWDSTDNKMFVWNGAAWDDLSTVATAESIDNLFLADEVIAIRDVVYIDAADHVKKAKADALVTAQAIGFATNAAAAIEDPVYVRNQGILGGFTGLTAAAKYYVSPATAGAITATIPVGTGNVITQVGFAKSTTAIFVQIMSLGRRA